MLPARNMTGRKQLWPEAGFTFDWAPCSRMKEKLYNDLLYQSIVLVRGDLLMYNRTVSKTPTVLCYAQN